LETYLREHGGYNLGNLDPGPFHVGVGVADASSDLVDYVVLHEVKQV
jgi:hypothetical protein